MHQNPLLEKKIAVLIDKEYENEQNFDLVSRMYAGWITGSL